MWWATFLFGVWFGGLLFAGPGFFFAIGLGGRNEDVPKMLIYPLLWPLAVPLVLVGILR